MNMPNVSPVIPPPFHLQPKSIGEWVNHFPELRKPIIDGLLRQGETMNLIASSKVGKSYLAIDLAIAVALGRRWLDRFQTAPGNVLILDNELHRETIAQRVRQVAEARKIKLSDVADSLYIEPLRGRLRTLVELQEPLRQIQGVKFTLVILDAFYRFMPKDADENDNVSMASVFNLLDSVADTIQCAFVLIHHATKGNQSGKAITDVGAGAGSQSRAADSHLVLRAHEEDGVVVLEAAVRSWRPIEPFCLRWDYPVWNPADGLNPKALRRERRTAPLPTTKKKIAAPIEPWSVQRFVEVMIDDRLTPKRQILAQAKLKHDLSAAKAGQLLYGAEADGLIYRRSVAGDRTVYYSTKPQPPEPGI